jgi:hypothetical protein
MSGAPGGPRGRGGSVDRGRGRGRGSFHYSRGLSYEEPGDGVDSRGGLRGVLDRDRIEGPTSSATSFPRNIRPFDRSQVCIQYTQCNAGSSGVRLSDLLPTLNLKNQLEWTRFHILGLECDLFLPRKCGFLLSAFLVTTIWQAHPQVTAATY